jgi:hypothetical protein
MTRIAESYPDEPGSVKPRVGFEKGEVRGVGHVGHDQLLRQRADFRVPFARVAED